MKLPVDLFQRHEGEIKEHVRWGGQETDKSEDGNGIACLRKQLVQSRKL